MRTAIARNVSIVVVMAEVSRGVVPGPNRVSLGEASLWTESGVFVELLRAIAALGIQHEVVVANVAAGGVVGLERDTLAVTKTGANCPAGGVSEGGAA